MIAVLSKPTVANRINCSILESNMNEIIIPELIQPTRLVKIIVGSLEKCGEISIKLMPVRMALGKLRILPNK
jgi:hypothetical protein